jgi:ATP-dependent DNA ligase
MNQSVTTEFIEPMKARLVRDLPAPSNFSFLEPMMALRVQDLPVGNWLYEMKFDGYRTLTRIIPKDRESYS